MQVRSILRFAYRTDAAVENTQPMEVHEATAHLCELLWRAWLVHHSHQSSPIETYKRQTVSGRIQLDILNDVPIWHPRTHDTEWKQCLRNPDGGEDVRMSIELALLDHPTVYLE